MFSSKLFLSTASNSFAKNSQKIPASRLLSEFNKSDSYSLVPNRAIVEVEGIDSVKFLQGLCTNHMPKVERGGDGIYAGFLSPQGRILFDAFIYPKNKGSEFPHPSFLIEHDSAMTETLISHFKRYILRNKVHLSNVSDQYQTYQCWGPTTHCLWGSYVEPTAASKLPPGGLVAKERFCDVGTKDPRNSDMGLRILLPSNTTPKLPGNFRYVDYSDYTLRRLLLGVPEGVHDFFHNASLPLESNMDIMQGVDFRKGCYLGQELTIRTYHTGVTRKRIVPVQLIEPSNSFEDGHQYVDKSFDNRLPESQSEIRLDSQESQLASSRSTRTASGKFCQGMYNIGLALMRLDQISDSNGKPNVFTTENGLKLRAFVPDWWPGISH